MIFNTISPKVHGVIDYATAAKLIAGPYIFGFNKKDKLATTLSISTGISLLGLSLLTRYPLGAIKAIPFKAHGIVETSAASFLAISPLLFKYRTTRATRFLAIAGLATLGLVAMTNYGGVPKVVKKSKTETDQVAA